MSQPSDKTPGKPGQARTVGKYSIVRELGRGGMGVVYEATDTQLGRTVALKLMLPRPGLKPEQAEQERQRFVREAQMAAKLKHPGIVTLFEAGEIQGRRYLAMECVAGKPYSDWCEQKGLGLRAKVAVLRDVALAVHHAHEQGVLHRDLKPQNILVAEKNRPVVMDFGLAKAMSGETGLSLTGDGLVVGTPAYMSPEQAQGAKGVDGRTDVYALGVILYELLSGRKPFEGETAIEILMKASKERAAPPSSTRIRAPDPALDRTIENICLKAIERNPQDRYPSARALAQDLGRWLEGEAVHIASTHTRRRIRPKKKSPAWIFVAIGGAALAAVLLIFALPSSAPPGPDLELSRARQFLRERKYTEARIEYGKALAKDPGNAEAREGDRKARAAEEAERAALEKELEAKKAALQRELEAVQARSAREVEEAELKVKTASATATDAEQQRLREELSAIRERARLAEEEARRAREKLQELASTPPPTPAPASPPAPAPAPASPSPAPAPPPPPVRPAPDPKLALAALKEGVDAAVEKFDLPGIFKAVDAFAADAGADPTASKADALKRSKRLVKSRDDATLLALAQLRLADDAMAADDAKAAAAAAREAVNIAKAAGDAAVAEEAANAAKEFAALQSDVDRYLKARKTLALQPDDAAASADAGRYLCLIKDRWEEGLPFLARGSDETYKKLALQETPPPTDPAACRLLADAWWTSAQKERAKACKNGAILRALHWYEQALPGLKGFDKIDVDQRIDACYRQAPAAKMRVSFVPEKSMKLFPVGHRQGMFPEQKTDDATGPFRGEPVYFSQLTGTDVVYEIRSGRRLSKLRWKGAAMQNMTIEILDGGGSTVAKSGPHGGGNVYGEHVVEFPPLNRFLLRLSNHVSTWYFVDTLELK